ncbi:MAG: YggT family protein [Erysipelothrix sp.]|jgi:hypothetical protein|nr:YggT family protein [Erysipelothrix sp.]
MNNYNKKSENINTSTQSQQSLIRRILIVAFGLLETMLGFRFVFKIAGANPANALIKMLYDITEPIVGVFANIFTPATNNGLETTSVFEPGTLIAMVVIALLAIAVTKLMPQETLVQRNTTEHINNTNTDYNRNTSNQHTNNNDHGNNTDHVNNTDNTSNTDPYKSNTNINNDENKGDLK